ncbi:MAG TPA: FAD:protein FMN transferase [Methylomirabilota bacterium]|nr:FAD:protein FMN transferase [Methylomirabilota bacterium]
MRLFGKHDLTFHAAGSSVCALLSLAVFALFLASCATPAPLFPLKRYEFTEPQMGVPFRLVFYALNDQVAESAADAVYKRIAQLNQIFSDYETDSELNQLSFGSDTNAAPRKVSPELWDILQRSQRLAQKSGGAFDVTLGPVVHLWRNARREQAFPRADYLKDTLSRVGYQNLRLDPESKTVHLSRPRMRLDLGGIAKGYAVDEALRVLRTHGITRALVAASGDIGVGAPPPGATGWSIQLSEFDTNAPPLHVTLAERAVTTSGDLNQRLVLNGVHYSHIVDPRTGIGLTNRVLVTTIAKDCTTADSLATALSVLGPERGLELLKEYDDTEARFVRIIGSETEVTESKNFRTHLQ